MGAPILDAERIADHQARKTAQHHGQDRTGQGQRTAQNGHADNDPHGRPAVAHRLRGPALAGAGEQARQDCEDRGDAHVGSARDGDRQPRHDRGGGPGAHRGQSRQGQEESAQAAQERLTGGAPGAAQQVGQDHRHGHREGRQALHRLQGEDQDLAQQDGEGVPHIEGDAGGRLVGIGGQNEH